MNGSTLETIIATSELRRKGQPCPCSLKHPFFDSKKERWAQYCEKIAEQSEMLLRASADHPIAKILEQLLPPELRPVANTEYFLYERWRLHAHLVEVNVGEMLGDEALMRECLTYKP